MLGGFALEGGFLGVGEGVLGFEGRSGIAVSRLGAGFALVHFLAERLELLGFAAQAAYFYAGFGNEIAHKEILSWLEKFVPNCRSLHCGGKVRRLRSR